MTQNLKPTVVLHTANLQSGGGTSAVVRVLLDSPLAEEYDLRVVSQERAARGINVRLVREMADAMRRQNPALVHISGLQNEGFHGVLAARTAGAKKVLVGVHGFMEDALGYPRWKKLIVGRILEPLTLLLSTASYCVCEHGAKRFVFRRWSRRNLGVVHNGVRFTESEAADASARKQFGFEASDVIALSVCRLTIDKGLLDLAAAIGLLEAEGIRQPRLLIAGDGPARGVVQKAFASSIASGRAVMLGFRSDVSRLLRMCDLFVLPTLHENLSMAILEAMAAGKPVLTTTVGGNPELIDHDVSGLLVSPKDPKALASGIRVLAESDSLRKSLGSAALARARHAFSVQRQAEQLSAVYRMLLSRRLS